MLVLTRKLNEKIKIGDDITITIVKLRNNQIRIGIEAPRDVRVLRAELEKVVTSELAGELLENAVAETKPTNRVSKYLTAHSAAASDTSNQSRLNDVVDGMMSADEMIAAGKANDDEHPDDDSRPGYDGDHSPSTTLKVFSGRIGRDGEFRESNCSSKTRPSRAPLAGFFTAP